MDSFSYGPRKNQDLSFGILAKFNLYLCGYKLIYNPNLFIVKMIVWFYYNKRYSETGGIFKDIASAIDFIRKEGMFHTNMENMNVSTFP